MGDTALKSMSSLTVAIVDNDPADGELLRRLLDEASGVDTTCFVFHDASEALTAMRARDDIDVIFLDYVLGLDSGLDVLRELSVRAPGCPVVFMTGHGDQRVAAEAFKRGAADYLIKQDVTPITLRAALSRALTVRKQQAEMKRLQYAACHDDLTGVWRRGYFFDRCGDEIMRARRYRQPLAFALFDIDHFKRVNDTHGHQVGDAVLKSVAGAVQRSLRRTDMLGRYGGEEFCILLPQTPLDQALPLIERLRAAVERERHMGANGEFGVTASFGVTALAEDDESADDLALRADAALYRAKDAGRNRVEKG